jgi:hypothetical protein
VDADAVVRDAIGRTLAAAAEVLRQHTSDAGGLCWGCLDLWGRLAPYPCEQVKWATAVRAAYTRTAPH